jgi:hypothetical protein
MPATVRLVFHNGEMRDVIRTQVGRDMLIRGNRVRNAARRNVSKDTGRLAGSITSELSQEGDRIVVRIGSNLEYAIYVEKGTGIYAGRGMIRPKSGAFLAWPAVNNSGQGTRRYKGGATAGWVYARAVRGQPGQHYLERALDAAR